MSYRTENLRYYKFSCYDNAKRQWFSGKMKHYHCFAPGSIPGWRMIYCILMFVLQVLSFPEDDFVHREGDVVSVLVDPNPVNTILLYCDMWCNCHLVNAKRSRSSFDAPTYFCDKETISPLPDVVQ